MLAFVAYALLAVVVLLSVPVRVAVRADPRARPRFTLHFSWLFGLVHAPMTAGAQKSLDAEPVRKRRTMRGNSAKRPLAFLRACGGVTRLQRLLRDLVDSFHPTLVRVRIELGLGDPAATGQAWAILGPLSALLADRYDGQVMLEPNFMAQTLDVEGRAHLTIIPLQTLAIALMFLASPSTLRGLHAAHRAGSR